MIPVAKPTKEPIIKINQNNIDSQMETMDTRVSVAIVSAYFIDINAASNPGSLVIGKLIKNISPIKVGRITDGLVVMFIITYPPNGFGTHMRARRDIV